MKISELSRRSGLSVPTIKYYIRAGLLAPGARTRPNQAEYGPDHEQRLALIRGLVEAAEVSIEDVRQLTEVLDSDPDPAWAFGVAQQIVTAPIRPGTVTPASLERVRQALGQDASSAEGSTPAELAAARALDIFATVGIEVSDTWLRTCAGVGRTMAQMDLDELQARKDIAEQARIAALGTALGDVVLTSFRRASQAAEASRRFGAASGAEPAFGAANRAGPADDG